MFRLNKTQFSSGNELDELSGPINHNPNPHDGESAESLKTSIANTPKSDPNKPDPRLEALNRKSFF